MHYAAKDAALHFTEKRSSMITPLNVGNGLTCRPVIVSFSPQMMGNY